MAHEHEYKYNIWAVRQTDDSSRLRSSIILRVVCRQGQIQRKALENEKLYSSLCIDYHLGKVETAAIMSAKHHRKYSLHRNETWPVSPYVERIRATREQCAELRRKRQLSE